MSCLCWTRPWNISPFGRVSYTFYFVRMGLVSCEFSVVSDLYFSQYFQKLLYTPGEKQSWIWEGNDVPLSWLSSGFQYILQSWEKANAWNSLSLSLAFQQQIRTPTLCHSWNNSKTVKDFSVPGVSVFKTYIASTWSLFTSSCVESISHFQLRGLGGKKRVHLPCSSVLPNKADEKFSKDVLEPKHTGMLCCWKELVPL